MQAITAGSSINPPSFFKLPLIFIAIFFVIYFVGIQGIQCIVYFTNNMPIDFLLKNSVYYFLSLLLSLFLFFVTAVFCCQKYRLHSVSDSWRKVALIAIVFALLHFVWTIVVVFFDRFLISSLLSKDMSISDVEFWVNIIPLFKKVVVSILFIFILIFLFYLFAKKEVSSRAVFKLEGVKGMRIYSNIYSFLMLFSTIFIISYYLKNILRLMSMSLYVGIFEIIALLIIFIILFIYYITVYFSTRNSFKRIEPTAKLGKLIVTVIITYLFLLLSSILIAIVGSSMMTLVLFIINSVINLLLLPVFSRLSVKIMYS